MQAEDSLTAQVVPWTALESISLTYSYGLDLHIRGGRIVSLRANSNELCLEWVGAMLLLAAMRALRILERAVSPEWEVVCFENEDGT